METYVKTRLLRKIREFGLRDFMNLSHSEHLTLETLKPLAHEAWDWETILYHPHFTIQWIRELRDAPWPWNKIQDCPQFRIAWVREFIDKPLDFQDISRFDDIHDTVLEYTDKPWDWSLLSCNVPFKILRDHPTLPWNWSNATIFGPSSVGDICDSPLLPWDHGNLSFTNITDSEIRYITTFRHLFDDASWTDFSRSADWQVVKKNLGLPWVFRVIRITDVVTEKEFELMIEIGFTKWNWRSLSEWVDMDVIVKYPWYPWSARHMEINKTLEYRHVRRLHGVDNTFTPCETNERLVLEWTSAKKIQRAWRMCAVNPEYAVCRKILTQFINGFGQSVNSLCTSRRALSIA